MKFTKLNFSKFLSKLREADHLAETSEAFQVEILNSRKCIRLPKKLTPRLGYFIGFMLGDGGLKDTKKSFKRSGKREYKIIVGDCNRTFVQGLIQPLFIDLFRFDAPIRFERAIKGEKYYYVDPTCKAIHLFLTKVIGLREGQGKKTIPKLILSTDKEIKKYFLRGYLDAEGSIHKSGRSKNQFTIDVHCKDKALLTQIKQLSAKVFGIEFNGVYLETNSYKISTARKSEIFKAARERIFTHPKKVRLLNAAVAQPFSSF